MQVFDPRSALPVFIHHSEGITAEVEQVKVEELATHHVHDFRRQRARARTLSGRQAGRQQQACRAHCRQAGRQAGTGRQVGRQAEAHARAAHHEFMRRSLSQRA